MSGEEINIELEKSINLTIKEKNEERQRGEAVRNDL
jgi:hypothetical protein